MRFAALLALAASTLLAQIKTPDLCAPPPSAVAPMLPAHLMTGQGDIHFAITTKNKDAQKFLVGGAGIHVNSMAQGTGRWNPPPRLLEGTRKWVNFNSLTRNTRPPRVIVARIPVRRLSLILPPSLKMGS